MTEIGTQSKVGLIKFQQNIYILKQTLQDKGLFVYFGSYFIADYCCKIQFGLRDTREKHDVLCNVQFCELREGGGDCWANDHAVPNY